MQQYLSNKKVYLSGPIEFEQENDWRIKPTKILKDNFGLDVFDPNSDPKQKWVPQIKEAKNNKDYAKIAEIAKSFVRKDLGIVDRTDILIAYLPYKVPTTGTVHEIINSNNSKKPTLLISNMNDISYIPVWYYGFISPKFMFNSWEKLYDYLEEVNSGKHKDNNRWKLICGEI